MAISAIARLSVATATALSLSLLATVEALAYTFTKVAASNSIENPFYKAFAAPSLNDQGTVAFSAWLNPERTQEAIFTGNGGSLTVIADSKSPLFNADYTSPAINRFAATPIINNQGNVAFWAGLGISTGIFIGSGGPITTIADTSGAFSRVGAGPTINNKGTVVFTAALDAGGIGIFTSNNGVITTIATASPSSNLSATINNQGIVAFRQVDFVTDESGIFISNGQTTTTIADSSGSFDLLFNVSINDEGTVVFSGTLDAGGSGIFTSNGEVITTLVDTSGSFSNFSRPAINNQGLVAFEGTLDTGVRGIFTGSDPVANKVIAVGDTLFGSKVTDFTFSGKGLNNSGQIAFYAEFEDGTSGFFRADLDEPKSVPEPASVLGLLGVGVLGLVSRLKRQLA